MRATTRPPTSTRSSSTIGRSNGNLRGCNPERAETLPHPSVHIIFERNVGARVAGITRGRFSRVLEGQGGVIAAKFRPGGFRPFVCVDISTLTNKILSLSEMFGPDADTAAAARPGRHRQGPRG